MRLLSRITFLAVFGSLLVAPSAMAETWQVTSASGTASTSFEGPREGDNITHRELYAVELRRPVKGQIELQSVGNFLLRVKGTYSGEFTRTPQNGNPPTFCDVDSIFSSASYLSFQIAPQGGSLTSKRAVVTAALVNNDTQPCSGLDHTAGFSFGSETIRKSSLKRSRLTVVFRGRETSELTGAVSTWKLTVKAKRLRR